MHGLHTCTLHNSETLEPLTWTRVCPSHCYKCTLMCTHVLFCNNWTSVNIWLSNRSIVLSFHISTKLTLYTNSSLYLFIYLSEWHQNDFSSFHRMFHRFRFVIDSCTLKSTGSPSFILKHVCQKTLMEIKSSYMLRL